MPGYPDSHLADARGTRPFRRVLLAVPLIVAALWIGFYWFTTRVFPVSESYPGGQIKYAGYVRRSGVEAYRRHGHWIFNHPNGRMAADGFYDNGIKVGDWRYWDAAGQPTSQPAMPDS